uniref:Uncharacterized protein n=1 Tax=Lygus hesperus TaxID=30085 RepID=A0A0K8SI29_LYGHE
MLTMYYLLASNSKTKMNEVRKSLIHEFDITVLGHPKKCLVIKINRDRDNKTISSINQWQSANIRPDISASHLLRGQRSNTPSEPTIRSSNGWVTTFLLRSGGGSKRERCPGANAN